MSVTPPEGTDPALDRLAELQPDNPVRRAALEVEGHVADAGWDQPPALFALVLTSDLVAQEPGLADQLGDAVYTPIAQDDVPADVDLEEWLGELGWPDGVVGCAVVVERVMLPPEAEEQLPDDPALVADFAATHPDRQEVRLVAAVTRDGGAHSALRARVPADAPLLEGPDLVPGLVERLRHTFDE